MTELRNMSPKAYEVQVYRSKKWVQISTADILPGDIISIVRSQNDATVPCDVVMLSGTCIVNEAMLTGESTPQLKENIASRKPDEVLNFLTDKIYIVSSGTKVVQTAPDEGGAGIRSPDGGCVGYVLKTGFETSQGELIRTILFSTERVTANNTESLFFILFLLIFAIAAASHVWTEGIKKGRSRYQLLLDCILILTSVIPPELPMELSLAVNQSLIALFKYAIFCTEPFRIPFAGKIDICCFDKTGTLTTEQLVLNGVAGLKWAFLSLYLSLFAVFFSRASFFFGHRKDDGHAISKPTDLPDYTTHVLATCHSLMQLGEGLVGDPMEKAALEAIGWNFTKRALFFIFWFFCGSLSDPPASF